MDNNRLISVMAIVISFTSFGYALYGNPSHDKQNHSELSKEQVADVVKETLSEHPEIIIDSVEKYRAAKAQEDMVVQKEKIKNMLDKLENNPLDPKVGPSNASVKIVEFFDYNCGHCVKMAAIKSEVLKSDLDLQIIFKELPIMSQNSFELSKASLSVYQMAPEKYKEFQKALFEHSAPVESEADILALATAIGIDSAKLKLMMADPKISSIISDNIKTAQAIGVRGTPFYIINGEILPGASDAEELRKYIANARSAIQSNKVSQSQDVAATSAGAEKSPPAIQPAAPKPIN